MQYNATVSVDEKYDGNGAAAIVDALEGFHPAVSRNDVGRTDVVITVPAETLRQAITISLALVEEVLGCPAAGIEVITTAAFDRRNGLDPIPELVSVTEAAQLLGVTRQAIAQRIDAGTLPATKVGSTYAIPRSAVTTADDTTTSVKDPLGELAERFRRAPRETPPSLARMFDKIEKERKV